jgi:hypothetical protein
MAFNVHATEPLKPLLTSGEGRAGREGRSALSTLSAIAIALFPALFPTLRRNKVKGKVGCRNHNINERIGIS